MKVFSCPHCSHPIFFENSICINCNSSLGFQFNDFDFVPVDERTPYCVNNDHDVCNWLAKDALSDPFCFACSFNRIVPNFQDLVNYEKWKQLELAKHRLIYQQGILKLPMTPKSQDPENGLAFDFITPDTPEKRMTGHDHGLITILIDEGDPVHREKLRKHFVEPYRTVLGHFRHEIGHYFWMLLSDEDDKYQFQEFFGDESTNYTEALQNYYNNGAPEDWNLRFISKYASSHPWEDWAETWAHYLHIMDTLETAHYLGLSLLTSYQVPFMNLERPLNPYQIESFREIFEAGVSLTCAGNSLNRSMGLPDIYPFIWSETIYQKLEFIHRFVRRHQDKVI